MICANCAFLNRDAEGNPILQADDALKGARERFLCRKVSAKGVKDDRVSSEKIKRNQYFDTEHYKRFVGLEDTCEDFKEFV